MLRKADGVLLSAKSKICRFMNDLFHGEKGASDIVAIMVIIVIVLAVAVVFRTQLIALVQQVFGKATTWVEEN